MMTDFLRLFVHYSVFSDFCFSHNVGSFLRVTDTASKQLLNRTTRGTASRKWWFEHRNVPAGFGVVVCAVPILHR